MNNLIKKLSCTLLGCCCITFIFGQEKPVTSSPIKEVIKSVKPVINTSTGTSTSTTTQQATPMGADPVASALITDGREPSSIMGYISFVDPDNQRLHILNGQNLRTGEWSPLAVGSGMIVKFMNATTRELFNVSFVGGNAHYVAIDQSGNEIARGFIWGPEHMPVAFRYRVQFVFDQNYTGNPVLYENGGNSIRYNPNNWKFYDIVVPDLAYLNNSSSSYSVPVEDFVERPPMMRKRTSVFPTLPGL